MQKNRSGSILIGLGREEFKKSPILTFSAQVEYFAPHLNSCFIKCRFADLLAMKNRVFSKLAPKVDPNLDQTS